MTKPLPVPPEPPDHDKDAFLRSVLRELTGVLEKTVGAREAEAYVNYVGLVLGRALNDAYREAYDSQKLDVRQVVATLVDLKARIDGGFSVESMDERRIVLVNHTCPFGDKVIGRPSLCRMTANVFGSITAENLGYARVRIEKAIARGDPGCRVVISLAQDEAKVPAGETEFFGVN
jgi:predicted ArsR family transcriptional regulator